MVWFDGDGYSPDTTHLNPEIAALARKMEEMAGAPKEELGKREPGERGMYERT